MKRNVLFLFAIVLSLAATFSFSAKRALAAGPTGQYDLLTFPGASSSSCGNWSLDASAPVNQPGPSNYTLTLTDGKGNVVYSLSQTGSIGTFVNFLSDSFFTQPLANPIHVNLVMDGVTLANVSADDPCLPSTGHSAAVTWCLVGADGRADAKCGDRVAVYCNISANPPNLDVWGILNDSKGYRLFQFTFADLVKAGPNGITQKVEPLGTIHAAVDANNNFSVSWTGGPAGATGQKDFAKNFTCNFKR